MPHHDHPDDFGPQPGPVDEFWASLAVIGIVASPLLGLLAFLLWWFG